MQNDDPDQLIAAAAAKRTKESLTALGTFSLLLILGCLCCGVIGWFAPDGDVESPVARKQVAGPIQPQQEKLAAPVRRTTFQPGDDVLFVNPGGKIVLVAATNADLSEYQKLSDAEDFIGIAKMVQQGRLFKCDVGCPARMLDPGVFAHEVRIMGGPNIGESGFVETGRVVHEKEEFW